LNIQCVGRNGAIVDGHIPDASLDTWTDGLSPIVVIGGLGVGGVGGGQQSNDDKPRRDTQQAEGQGNGNAGAIFHGAMLGPIAETHKDARPQAFVASAGTFYVPAWLANAAAGSADSVCHRCARRLRRGLEGPV
jgi:hypothetical protein